MTAILHLFSDALQPDNSASYTGFPATYTRSEH